MNFNLDGYSIGQKQKSGVMSVYPILGNGSGFNIASFNDISFEGTCDYGTMIFSNNSDKPFIIPSGYSIITKQAAQDHGLPNAQYLNASAKNKKFSNACCIQETQCGYIKPIDSKEFRYLPLNIRKSYLRDEIYTKRNFQCFSRLWDYIHSFQQDLVKSYEGNLVLFFDKYLNDLANFNAEFECVEGQIGAIIMLNDTIVGIEIAPNQEYWKFLWKSLIRDCYGSEVIRRIETNLIDTFKSSISSIVDYSTCNSLEDIISTYNNFSFEQVIEGLKILKDLEKIDFSNNSNKPFKDDLSYCKIYKDEIVGEVFKDKDNKIVYLSLLF